MASKYRKRADGRYSKQVTVGIYPDGRPIRKTVYGKTIKELEKNYRNFMDLKDKGIILNNDRITFRELSQLWLANKKVGLVKDQSVTNIRYQLNNLNRSIGDYQVKDITLATLENFRKLQLESGKLDQYNKSVRLLRNVYAYALEKCIVPKNIALQLEYVKYSTPVKRCLTQSERKLIDTPSLSDWERCFLYLLLYTGVRKGEALALTVSDIDFSKRVIHVNKTLVTSKKKKDALQEEPKTSSGNRTIPISKNLLPILQAYCSNHTGILFQSSRGGYIASFPQKWQWILDKLREANGGELADDITPHIFRHTYASDLYKAGMDVKSAQYLLGHSDIKTTLGVYTHFGYGDVRIDCLEDYYNAVKMQSDKIVPIQKAL